MIYKVFNNIKNNHLEQPMFFGEGVNIARYDEMRYPYFDKLIDKQLSNFWRPEEVGLMKDISDWKKLTDAEKHIFTSNLKRQTVLDSSIGRGVNVSLLSVTSAPELEAWIENWGMNETLHSRSYTYILKNLFAEPNLIFDEILDIPEIISCTHELTKYFDDFIEYSSYRNLLGLGIHTISSQGKTFEIDINERELKKKIILLIASINILEGVRFYVSFACSWAFAERELMEGNAKIIRLICRDENVHLSSTQYMLNNFKMDPQYKDIYTECIPEIEGMFDIAVLDEKNWADYLFKDDSMIGLNANLLYRFIEWIANKRLSALGLEERFETTENSLPWIHSWISQNGESKDVQVAPQETEISSYLIGSVNSDAEKDSFSDFKLSEDFILK